MNLLKRPIALLLFLTASLATAAVAQQKRPAPAKPQPSAPAPAAPTPPPTFETLLAADSYKIYGEVRSVGQFIRSNSVNEILEPILKLAGPPKEFRNVVKWLNLHAEEVMTSRMLVGFEPGRSGLPTMLVAIEFPSAEEATKFQLRLNEFLPKILPAPSKTIPTLTPVEKEPPPYFIQQAGSLILVTPTKADLKKLRPVGSKLLAEDVNFRVARNRFNSEAIFIYVDVDGIEREEQERSKQFVPEKHVEPVVEASPEAAKQRLQMNLRRCRRFRPLHRKSPYRLA